MKKKKNSKQRKFWISRYNARRRDNGFELLPTTLHTRVPSVHTHTELHSSNTTRKPAHAHTHTHTGAPRVRRRRCLMERSGWPFIDSFYTTTRTTTSILPLVCYYFYYTLLTVLSATRTVPSRIYRQGNRVTGMILLY